MGKLRFDRPQLIFAIGSAVFAAIAAVLVFADNRELLGAPLWMKPFKFFVSAALMSLTLALVIPRIDRARRLVQVASVTIMGSLAIELVLITWAAANETTSHFNVSSPLAISVWTAMAGFITAVWVATMILALLYLRHGSDEPLMKRAVSWGMGISLLGMGVAFLMTGPTPDQLADFQGIAGAHTVGALDGGPGIPLFGWSTVAGDLRIPHFFGLHALQLVPLAAWLISGRASARSIDLIAVGYLVFIAILTVQALLGQSILSTSPLLGLALLAATAGPTLVALLRPKRIEEQQ